MEITQSPRTVVESGGKLADSLILEGNNSKEHSHGQGAEAVKDVVCGSVAGIVGKYIEYPFDTVKVRLQSQPDHLPLRYTGPLDCFRQSLKQDGFLGIYRGISAPLVGAAVENACLFFSYRVAQDAFKASGIYPHLKKNPSLDLPYPALLVCGAISGSFASVFLTPIELVKCKMQVPIEVPGMPLRKPTILKIISSVWRHQGIMGFWHGQMGTLIRETGGGVAWFGGFEGMKLVFKRTHATKDEELPIWQKMAAGAVAGMSYNFLFYPADTVKSRMQTEDVKKMTGGKSTFSAVGKAIWKQHGLKGLYRGCGITVARSIPSSAFIFTIYEELKTRWPAGREVE